MLITKPTIGRNIEFRNNEGQVFAGIISKVFDKGTVNVHYFDGDNGKTGFASSVPHNGDGSTYSWRYLPHTEDKIDA